MNGFVITDGVINGAQKVVFYGPEGVGKSTFASNFPDPLFIDTEGSTKKLNVKRLPKPTSWQMLIDETKYVIQTKLCKTLVIDTADWAESLCTESVCARYGHNGVEDFGYGNGYTYVREEWGRFLNLLQDVVDIANINVVLTAHAIIRKFEQPNEMGAYDRWELKLGKKTTGQTAPITKEWADMILFANYKVFSVAVDDKGKKHKAQGGQRVMYTTHNPCWDAKNRDGLPEELPLDYSKIAHIFNGAAQNSESVQSQPVAQPMESASTLVVQPQIKSNQNISQKIDQLGSEMKPIIKEAETKIVPKNNTNLPKALQDLMNQNLVTEDELKKAVASKGYYPYETPIEKYDQRFIDGVLIAAWPQVFKIIDEQIRQF